MNDEERQARDAEIARIREEMTRPLTKVQQVPSSSSSSSSSEEEGSDGSSNSEEEEEGGPVTIDSFPIHDAFVVKSSAQHHSKAIQHIAWDKNRTRMATGSLDGTACLWDTNMLLSTSGGAKPVRELSRVSATTGSATDQAITALDFNASGQLLVVARRDAQMRIFDRDGTNGKGASEAKHTTTLGDVYLRDMSKTKGHVGAVSHASFSHVREPVLFSSGEMDGTIRIWDCEAGPKALMGLEMACTHTLRYPAKPGARNSIHTFCHSSESNVLFAGSTGGLLHMWDARVGGGGAFGALPTQTTPGLCASAAAKGGGMQTILSMALKNHVLVACKRDMVEARDVRAIGKTLWQFKAPPPLLVRGVTPLPNAAVAITCSDALVLVYETSGREIGRTTTTAATAACTTSNLVADGTRFIRGSQDGTFTISFTKGAAVVAAPLTRGGSTTTTTSSSSTNAYYYARIDESRAHTQGEIMPASEALKLVKGTKRMKNDLREDD